MLASTVEMAVDPSPTVVLAAPVLRGVSASVAGLVDVAALVAAVLGEVVAEGNSAEGSGTSSGISALGAASAAY